jgi:hypothetical protein
MPTERSLRAAANRAGAMGVVSADVDVEDMIKYDENRVKRCSWRYDM